MPASEQSQQQTMDEWRTDEHLRMGMHVLVFFRPNDSNPAGHIVLYKEEVERWKKMINNLNNK